MGEAVLSELVVFPLAPAESGFEVHEFLLFSWNEVDAQDVEANRWAGLHRQLSNVGAGQFAKGMTLVRVDGNLSSGDVVSRARLHFDEAEHLTLPGNQVEITALVAARPRGSPCGEGKRRPHLRLQFL